MITLKAHTAVNFWNSSIFYEASHPARYGLGRWRCIRPDIHLTRLFVTWRCGAVLVLVDEFRMSKPWACLVVGQYRRSYRHEHSLSTQEASLRDWFTGIVNRCNVYGVDKDLVWNVPNLANLRLPIGQFLLGANIGITCGQLISSLIKQMPVD